MRAEASRAPGGTVWGQVALAARVWLARLMLLIAMPLLVAACGAPGEVRTASPAEAARAAYVSDAPPSITLVSVINSASGTGDHSALIINASQRVLYDPAGSFHNPAAPQNLDVHFGYSPGIEATYMNYHSRETHHVVTQRLLVSPEIAEAALRNALAETKARPGQCSIKTTAVLRATGFEGVGGSVWPRTTMNNFARVTAGNPGLRTEILIAPGTNPQVLGLDAEFAATAVRVPAPSGLLRPVVSADDLARAN